MFVVKLQIYKNETINVAVSPEYRKIVTFPAEYRTIQEKVLIKESGQEVKIVPAVWGTQEVTYFEREDGTRLESQKALFIQGFETVETKAASAS
jgi:hypothetical protein